MRLPGKKFLIVISLAAIGALLILYAGAGYYVNSGDAAERFRSLLLDQAGIEADWERISFSWRFEPRFSRVTLRGKTEGVSWSARLHRLDVDFRPSQLSLDAVGITVEPNDWMPEGARLEHLSSLILRVSDAWRCDQVELTRPEIHLSLDGPAASDDSVVAHIPALYALIEDAARMPDLPEVDVRDGIVSLFMEHERVSFTGVGLTFLPSLGDGARAGSVVVLTAEYGGEFFESEFRYVSQLGQLDWDVSFPPGLPSRILPPEYQTYLSEMPGVVSRGFATRQGETMAVDLQGCAYVPQSASCEVSARLDFSEARQAIGKLEADATAFFAPGASWPFSGDAQAQLRLSAPNEDDRREVELHIPQSDISLAVSQMHVRTGPGQLNASGYLDSKGDLHIASLHAECQQPHLLTSGKRIEIPTLAVNLSNGKSQGALMSAEALTVEVSNLAYAEVSDIRAASDGFHVGGSRLSLARLDEALLVAERLSGVTIPVLASGELVFECLGTMSGDDMTAQVSFESEDLGITVGQYTGTGGQLNGTATISMEETLTDARLVFAESLYSDYTLDEPIELSGRAGGLEALWSGSEGGIDGAWSMRGGPVEARGYGAWMSRESEWVFTIDEGRLDLENLVQRVTELFFEAESGLIATAARPVGLAAVVRGGTDSIRSASTALHWTGLSLGYVSPDSLLGLEEFDGVLQALYTGDTDAPSIRVAAMLQHPDILADTIAVDIGSASLQVEALLVPENEDWQVDWLRLSVPAASFDARRLQPDSQGDWSYHLDCRDAERFAAVIATPVVASKWPWLTPLTANGEFTVAGELQWDEKGWRTVGNTRMELDRLALGEPLGLERVACRLPYFIASDDRGEWQTEAGSVHIGAATWGLIHLKEVRLTPTMYRQSVSWPEEFAVNALGGEVVFGPVQVERILERDCLLKTSMVLDDIALNQLNLGRKEGIAGDLSANMPEITFSRDWLRSTGGFELHVFDGRISASDLAVSDPLSGYPVWHADIDIVNVDFEKFTRYFGFGRIDGQLTGHIRDLELDCARIPPFPIGFNLELWSPENKIGIMSREALGQFMDISGQGLVVGTLLDRDYEFSRIGLRAIKDRDGFRIWGRYNKDGSLYDEKGTGLSYFMLPNRSLSAWISFRNQLALTYGNSGKMVSFQSVWERIMATHEPARKEGGEVKVESRFTIPIFDRFVPFLGQYWE